MVIIICLYDNYPVFYAYMRRYFMKKTILTIAIIAIIMAAPLWAQSESDFEVRQNPDNTITITRYNGSVRDVVIPATLHGLRVTVIGDLAFSGKRLTSVVIPNTVITIEDGRVDHHNLWGAFSHNDNLTRVTLGNSIRTIGACAFARTGLTEIVIPNSVTSIGSYAFSISSIRRVTFGSGLRTIGGGVFSHNQITELNLPASIQAIEDTAFWGNQIRSLIIPNTVTSVGYEAFLNNPIETLVIPASLARGGLGNGVFNYSENLVNITLPANIDAGVVRSNFGEAFANFYVNQNRAGGTYLKRGPIWTRATAAELREMEEARRQEEARRIEARRLEEEARQAAIRQEEEARAAAAARQAELRAAAEAAGLPVNWKTQITPERNITTNFSIGRETIQRQERDVLVFEINFAQGVRGTGRFYLEDAEIIQRLKNANGIRFKVQGDGLDGWNIRIVTSDEIGQILYGTSFRTRNNNVVNVDIPFRGLRQLSDTAERGRVAFNKNNIAYLCIDRTNANGNSTLKIFDFEIY